MSAGGLGHVSANDFIDIIQCDVLQTDGAEGGLPIIRLLFDVQPLPF